MLNKFSKNLLIHIIIILVALVVWKEGFESFDDQNLFLFTDLTGVFSFVAHHQRRLPFPRQRVEGHRHHRQRADSRFKRSGLLSKVRIDRF